MSSSIDGFRVSTCSGEGLVTPLRTRCLGALGKSLQSLVATNGLAVGSAETGKYMDFSALGYFLTCWFWTPLARGATTIASMLALCSKRLWQQIEDRPTR